MIHSWYESSIRWTPALACQLFDDLGQRRLLQLLRGHQELVEDAEPGGMHLQVTSSGCLVDMPDARACHTRAAPTAWEQSGYSGICTCRAAAACAKDQRSGHHMMRSC